MFDSLTSFWQLDTSIKLKPPQPVTGLFCPCYCYMIDVEMRGEVGLVVLNSENFSDNNENEPLRHRTILCQCHRTSCICNTYCSVKK